jgi:hypothetical protein
MKMKYNWLSLKLILCLVVGYLRTLRRVEIEFRILRQG